MVPEDICVTFGLTGVPHPLAGGLSHAYRFLDVVVKPVEDRAEATLIAHLMATVEVDPALVRVARPVPAADGAWVAGGWAAWRWEAGEVELEGRQSWSDALAAAAELHRGLAAFERPELLASRNHLWAIADRFAWQESALELTDQVAVDLVRRCLDAYGPVDLPSQLVHGDMYANLLFADGLAPAVIDFSPYWRPAGWGRAVYVIDGLGRACERELVQLII